MRTGRAVTDYVRESGPAILQVHTYRFQGHSPADPEHERGRKQEKMWARAECDPIKIFEVRGGLSEAHGCGERGEGRAGLSGGGSETRSGAARR